MSEIQRVKIRHSVFALYGLGLFIMLIETDKY